MASAEDFRWMRAALALGAQGLGRVWPNPSVGCVIVKDGRLVGRGVTAVGGRPHAEAIALAQAGPAARAATAYVTLEPCAHHGKTPPCAEALISAGVSRVVIALQDPDPRVSGQGISKLKAAGISVEQGCVAPEARVQHQGFLTRITEGRPMLTLKLASTIDGRIATASGESQWITGPSARAHVHAQRARHDAVMVGGGTARNDDPELTVRGFGDLPRPPVRIVLSRRLDLPLDSRLTRSVDRAPLWLCHGTDCATSMLSGFENRGARLIACAIAANSQLDLVDIFQKLGTHGLTRVYCEGGGALAASLLQAGLVDRLDLYTAGKLIGAEGTPSLGALGLERLSEAPQFSLNAYHQIGGDLYQRWERLPSED